MTGTVTQRDLRHAWTMALWQMMLEGSSREHHLTLAPVAFPSFSGARCPTHIPVLVKK